MNKKTVAFLILCIICALPIFIDAFGLACFLGGIILCYGAAENGIKCALPGYFLMLLTAGIISGIFKTAFLGIMLLPPAVLGVLINKKISFPIMLMISTGAETAALTGVTVYLSSRASVKPCEYLFGDSVRQFSEALSAAQTMNPEAFSNIKIEEIGKIVEMIPDMLRAVLPSLYVILSLTIIYITFCIVRKIFEKQNRCLLPLPHFYELSLPHGISSIFVVLFLVSVFFINSPILSNVVFIMFAVHVICGISLVDYILLAKHIPSGIRALILIVIVLLISLLGGFASSVLCCFGMTDRRRFIRK